MAYTKFLALAGVAALLAACGGDSSSNKVSEPAERFDIVTDTFDDLPECSDECGGASAYVKDEKNAYVCEDGDWTLDADKSSSNLQGEKLSSSSVTGVSLSSAKSESSSSIEKSHSSSSKALEPAEGTLTDTRDGQTYKTVTIGTQTWMAENLNYAYTDVPFKFFSYTTDSTSWCYNEDASNCTKYGRLYTWAAAMDSVGMWSTNGKGCGYDSPCSPIGAVRGICPEGWHLPSLAELYALYTAAGGQFEASEMLKSKSDWGLLGKDTIGFSALPAGQEDMGEFLYEGVGAYFWSSTEGNSYEAYTMGLVYHNSRVNWDDLVKISGHSVRCLKDDSGPSATPKSSCSSLVGKTSCNENTDENCIKDERDCQTYKTVTIGTQTWMAENLNYAYTDVPFKFFSYTTDSTSWCYNEDASNCTKYGRLYTWAAAMDSVGMWSTNGKGCGYGSICTPNGTVRGVCPEGWHLPTSAEWETLVKAAGSPETAAKELRSTSGWSDISRGTDAYGFSVLPAGYWQWLDDGNFYMEGGDAHFWSSTERLISINDGCCSRAYYMDLNYYDEANLDYGSKYDGYSVRCLKD